MKIGEIIEVGDRTIAPAWVPPSQTPTPTPTPAPEQANRLLDQHDQSSLEQRAA